MSCTSFKLQTFHPSYTDKILLRPSLVVRFAKIYGHKNVTISLQVSLTKSSNGAFCKTTPGTGRESIGQDCMQVLQIFVSETRQKRAQKYLVSESWGASLKRLAVISQWIHLRLLSCSSVFKSQAQHLWFFYLCLNCDVKRPKTTKIDLWPIL